MLRRAMLVPPFLLLGCASPRTSAVIVSDAASVAGTEAPPDEARAAPDAATRVFTDPVEAPAAPDAATGVFTDFAPESQIQSAPPPPPPRYRRQRFTLKGGYYGSSEDGIDDGYIINLAWMRPVSELFSSEVEIGYLDASGTDKGVDRDVWSIPFLANARLTLPVGQKMELYGGLGLGTFYYNADAKAAGVSVSADGFLFGGDAFFGGAIHLGQSLWVGLEGKYYVTDNASDLGGGLDAYVVMLTLGFER